MYSKIKREKQRALTTRLEVEQTLALLVDFVQVGQQALDGRRRVLERVSKQRHMMILLIRNMRLMRMRWRRHMWRRRLFVFSRSVRLDVSRNRWGRADRLAVGSSTRSTLNLSSSLINRLTRHDAFVLLIYLFFVCSLIKTIIVYLEIADLGACFEILGGLFVGERVLLELHIDLLAHFDAFLIE